MIYHILVSLLFLGYTIIDEYIYKHYFYFNIFQAGRPIINMIINWMVEGELFDPHNEFFISINTNCHDRDIWRDKFVLR